MANAIKRAGVAQQEDAPDLKSGNTAGSTPAASTSGEVKRNCVPPLSRKQVPQKGVGVRVPPSPPENPGSGAIPHAGATLCEHRNDPKTCRVGTCVAAREK